MRQDPIVTEVRRARETHAAQFNFELRAIYRDLKAQEKQNQRQQKVSFAPKRIQPVKIERKPVFAV